jgi:hypothetical protein
MAKVNWSRRFDDPVPMPDGSTIRTIGEAAEYARNLPKRLSDTVLWQHAAGDLLMASEHAAFVFLARASFNAPSMATPRRRSATRKARKATCGARGSWRGIGDPVKTLPRSNEMS